MSFVISIIILITILLQTVKKAIYKPNGTEVAVKMMQANAMSEADFILEATTMQ